MSEAEGKVTAHLLPKHMTGGPMGLGDPDDRTLRIVEKNVLIPKMLKEEIMKRCAEDVAAFQECGKVAGLKLTFSCVQENRNVQACYAKWYNDEKYHEEIKELYLQERSIYRRTGVPVRKFMRKF